MQERLVLHDERKICVYNESEKSLLADSANENEKKKLEGNKVLKKVGKAKENRQGVVGAV
jgi:hypothetical protein